MTKEEAKKAIKNIPIGAKIQVIQKSGNIMDVRLSSHEVGETSKKEYGTLTVPELPPALLVNGHIRQDCTTHASTLSCQSECFNPT